MLDLEDMPTPAAEPHGLADPEGGIVLERSSEAASDDDMPIFELEIPHPLETLARRPRRHPPRWKPRAVPAAERGLPLSTLEGWRSPRIVADADAGAVAIDFKYCHFAGATAVFSDKARRQQFMSGPHEKARWRLLESAAEIVDFQFQPFTIVWTTADGKERGYTPDTLELRRDGRLIAREEKADRAYHEVPETADLLDIAEAFLATKGIEFERSTGQPDPLAWRTQKDVADCRRFDFSAVDLRKVREELDAGSSNVGRLICAIGGKRDVAALKIRSMTARGLVAIGTERPWTCSTPAASVGEPVTPTRLRDFLREHAGDPIARRNP